MNKDAMPQKSDNESAIRIACGRELRRKRLLHDVVIGDFQEFREKELLAICTRELALKRRHRRMTMAVTLSLAAGAVLVVGILFWRIGGAGISTRNKVAGNTPDQSEKKHSIAKIQQKSEAMLPDGSKSGIEVIGNMTPKYETIGNNTVVARITSIPLSSDYYVRSEIAASSFAVVKNVSPVERVANCSMPQDMTATKSELLVFGERQLALIGFGPDENSSGRFMVINNLGKYHRSQTP